MSQVKIIAELCQNHSGDIDILKKMSDSAAAAGATHLKIQHVYTKNLSFRPIFENGLVQDGITYCIKRPWKAEFDRLQGLELKAEDCVRFVEYVKSLGLIPMTTCFARCDAAEIRSQGFESIKVASYDCASFQLIRELCEVFDELFVSTGATYDDEVTYANELLKGSGKPYHLLHCVTQYPTPLSSMNLARISWLEEQCPSVGFSDHSLVSRDGVIAAKAAIAMGAQIIERHFTIQDEASTKDGPVSIGPGHLKDLVEFSKLSKNDQIAHLDEINSGWRTMLGSSSRPMTNEEILNRSYYRGRFASPCDESTHDGHKRMVYNWEEIAVVK